MNESMPRAEQASPEAELLRSDAAARADALDTARSFIVRAPAGSGKTELLTQRVLALLATVDTPEEIVAVTFTRKAASEMKDRLIAALERAATEPAEVALDDDEAHQATTLRLARRVLQRDRELGWELGSNPARLRVQTIDALAHWLAQQLPIAMRFGAVGEVTERADAMYERAARATLGLIDSQQESDRDAARHIARLLTHLDNDLSRLHRLFSGMLEKRDQWLRHIGHLDRPALEAPLRNACSEQIARICRRLPSAYADELVALARYAAANTDADSIVSPCADLDGLPHASHQRLDAWCGLAGLLLTKEGEWRAKIDKTLGFPATADGRPFKHRHRALIDALRADNELRFALHGLRELPAPQFSDSQWEVLESIVALLPRAAAELMLVFGDDGRTDFVQLTRAAVTALGEPGAASELAHAMDARIRHLLIDEFQDTSITQFELIERLIAQWQDGDGRTIFVVGDPMQSIYRFREAEVGLFLRAWNRGIGATRLQPLQLARNFRSHSALVNWVNTAFAQILPAINDIATGAVAFEPSVAGRARLGGDQGSLRVHFHALFDSPPTDEAARVVNVVRSIQAQDPAASIALLVRSRPHLTYIAPALRRAQVPFTAVELDPLSTRPLIGDLLALTRALEHLADRVAWLAILRAPWCGLTLADLCALAEGAPDATVWQLLRDPVRQSRLSPDGRERLARVLPVLVRAIELRGRAPLAQRVRDTWRLLGGPACVAATADAADASAFFAHLVEHEGEAGGFDRHRFETSLSRLYATVDVKSESNLQVMTIHRAKGLEFDHVIVPALDRVPRSDVPQLLLWLERPAEVGGDELLLSPIDSSDAGKTPDSIYRWIAWLHAERQAHEDERLLYVAATRARKGLTWLAQVATQNGEVRAPPQQSLLSRLWLAIGHDCNQQWRAYNATPTAVDTRSRASMPAYDQSLRRLPSGWTPPIAPPSIKWSADVMPVRVQPAIEFSWAGQTARRIGIVVHRWLQRIADDALEGWTAERVRSIGPGIARELAAVGVSGDELRSAARRVEHALTSALDDPKARWLLGPHTEARSELQLTLRIDGVVSRIALDRTFVDERGCRCIIDYKTGMHEGTDAAAFLDREQLRYRQQLEDYAAAFTGPRRLGLYFPLVPGWREWSNDD
ncbi:MAG: UvrD-helicase domain-containing protein [Burkholderiaceae bacterium]